MLADQVEVSLGEGYATLHLDAQKQTQRGGDVLDDCVANADFVAVLRWVSQRAHSLPPLSARLQLSAECWLCAGI